MKLRLGTRRSALAMTQSTGVAERLRALGHTVEVVPVVTQGDVSTAPLTAIGGTGVFVAQLRQALLTGEVDLAVHSLKDLPSADHEATTLAAVPVREDPRDVLVAPAGATLADLPRPARVGTGSPRRAAQLAALDTGIVPVPIRGNVDTRLALALGPRPVLDAVVLARAGLARLGRLDAVTQVLPAETMLPAAGQGALAIETLAARDDVRAAVGPLDDAVTHACVAAERAVLRTLRAGCTAPVGVLAELDGDGLRLRAVALTADGARAVRAERRGPLEQPERLGEQVAAVLLDGGADAILRDAGIPWQPNPVDDDRRTTGPDARLDMEQE